MSLCQRYNLETVTLTKEIINAHTIQGLMCVNIKLNQGSWELQALATQVRSPSMAAGEKGSELVTVFDGIFCDFLFYFGESSFCTASILSGLLPLRLKLSGRTAWICFRDSRLNLDTKACWGEQEVFPERFLCVLFF